MNKCSGSLQALTVGVRLRSSLELASFELRFPLAVSLRDPVGWLSGGARCTPVGSSAQRQVGSPQVKKARKPNTGAGAGCITGACMQYNVFPRPCRVQSPAHLPRWPFFIQRASRPASYTISLIWWEFGRVRCLLARREPRRSRSCPSACSAHLPWHL